MTRWLALLLGLAAAALAVWSLAARRAPLDDIDDASRARLEQVLRDADTQPGAKP